jgi:hypothetical protein
MTINLSKKSFKPFDGYIKQVRKRKQSSGSEFEAVKKNQKKRGR